MAAATIGTRNRLRDWLLHYSRVRILAEANSAEQLVSFAGRLSFDTVVAEAELPGLSRAVRLHRSTKLVAIALAPASEPSMLREGLLAAGAVDVLASPAVSSAPGADAEFARKLFTTLRNACGAGATLPVAEPGLLVHSPVHLIEAAASLGAQRRTLPPAGTPRVVLLGASTGGPRALETLLPMLEPSWPFAYVIVQHMSAQVTQALVRQLAPRSRVEVKEAADGDVLRPGKVFVAPGGRHLTFMADGRVRISDGPEVNYARPSVDVALVAAARVFGSRTIAVLLTGMGNDGSQGLMLVKRAGGLVLAQDRASSTVFGMPKAAIETGLVDRVVPLHRIAKALHDIFDARVGEAALRTGTGL